MAKHTLKILRCEHCTTQFFREPAFSGVLPKCESFFTNFFLSFISNLLHHGFMICPSYRSLHNELLK